MGLPPHTPVDDWILHRPEAVVTAHRGFVRAGAEIVLAATFRALPDVTDRWRAVAEAAVRLARLSGAPQVWASVGPPAADPEAAATLVAAVAEDVDGVVLETFVDPAALVAATGAVRARYPGPLVATLVPDPDGAVGSGQEPDPVLRRLLAAGADGVGFNCGTDPGPVVRAVARTDVAPLWAKPAGGPGIDAALRGLAERCRWVGGCCGVDAATLARAVEGVAWPMA